MRKPLCILGVIAAVGVYVIVASVGGAPGSHTRDARQPAPEPSAAMPDDGRGPRAVVECVEHDFGVCDPMESGSHVFLVRNQGDAPLELQKGPASCKCTLTDLPGGVVPPGESGKVRLSWTATTKYVLFNQQAVVLTNDPEHPSLVFRIKGEVRNHLLAEPEEVVFSSLAPGEIETRSVTLFSQAWEAFEIKEIKASSPALRWTVKPAPAEALAEVKGRSGYLLEVTSPKATTPPGAGQSTGHFQETLTVVATAKGDAAKGLSAQQRVCQLVVSGNRVGWLRVAGQGVDANREVSLGTIPQGQSLKRRLTLLVRDPNHKLRIQRVETSLSFLRATLTPVRDSQAETAWSPRYHLDLEVPPDAPACTYGEAERATLRIQADDPTVPEVKVPIAFAVVPSDAR